MKNTNKIKQKTTTIDANEKISKRKSDFNYNTRSKRQKLNENENLSESTIVNVETKKTKAKKTNNALCIEYTIGEVVWGKIRGSPDWPAKIVNKIDRKYELLWFNDYRKTMVFYSSLSKFYDNFEKFSKHFETKVGLECAAKEALLYLASK